MAAPLKTVTKALSKAVTGQTIILRAGTYHESNLITKEVTIQAYPNEAVYFDGSVPVTTWAKSGAGWVSAGWTNQFDHSASFSKGSDAGGFVNPAYPMAAYPDQVFADGTQLTQVAANPGVGQFSVDYTATTITVGSDPTGTAIRASNLAQAFIVSAPNVTLRGFGVQRYGNSLATGAAIYMARPNDRVQNVVMTDIATVGMTMYKGNDTIDHVTIIGAGMLGILSNQADGLAVTNSIVTRSNSQHFNTEPASAAIKLSRSRNVTISNNELSDGYDALGIWTDESVVGFTIVGNTVRDNGTAANIETELSDTGIIANNLVSGSDRGVYIFDTANVKVFNNTFTGNSRGSVFISQDFRRETTPGNNHDPRQPLPDPTCPWIVNNITIANNLFAFNGGAYGFQIYALDKSTNIAARSMNITTNGNIFHTRSTSTDSMIGWGGSDNNTVTKYETPAAFNASTGNTGTNLQDPTGSTVASMTRTALTATNQVPLTADIANAIGVTTGTRHTGTF
jgi:parallel beta-helix repeat protein